jgi:hypothetical protein
METAGFRTPVEDRYFEDYVPGAVHEFGRIKLTKRASLPLGNNSTLSFSTLNLTAQNQRYTAASLPPAGIPQVS